MKVSACEARATSLQRVGSYQRDRTLNSLAPGLDGARLDTATAMFIAHAARSAVAVALLAIFASTAHASRIDIADFAAGEVLVVNGRHVLTYEDLLVLSSRNDNGWHLGWFKNKLGDPRDPMPPLEPPIVIGPSWPPDPGAGPAPVIVVGDLPGGSVITPSVTGADSAAPGGSIGNPAASQNPGTNADGQPAAGGEQGAGVGNGQTGGGVSAQAIPEPAMLVLMGVGTLAVARRMARQRTSPRR